MIQPKYVSETETLWRVANDPGCRLVWTKHALEMMNERAIAEPDVERVLTKGRVVLAETAKRDVLWRVEGSDIDGRRLTVVAAIYEAAIKIKIVTSF